MADNDITRRLNLASGDLSALKAVEAMAKSLDRAKKTAADTSRATQSGFENSGKAIDKNTDKLRALEDQTKKAAKAADNLGKKQASFNSGGFLRNAAQAAGAVGGGEAQVAIAGLDDLVGFIGELGPVSVVAAGALGATTLALNQFNKTVGEAQTQLKGAIAAQDEYYRLLNSGTTEDAAARLDQANTELANKRKQLAELENAREIAFQSEQQSRGDLAARVLFAVGGVTNAFGDLDAKAQELRESIAADEQTIKRLSGAIKEDAFAANDAKVATEDNTKAEEQLKAQRQQHQAAIASLNEQEKALNATYAERAKLTGQNRFKDDLRGAIDEAIARKRENEDLAKALEEQAAAHEKNLLDITKRGQDQIADVYKQIAEKEAAATKQIADLQAQYAADELKATQAFSKERKRIEDQFRKDEVRAKEDYRKSQTKSILENSVLSFLENKDNFKTNRKRNREDFRDEQGQALADFEQERAEAAQALQERILGIQTELAEFKAASALKILQIQQQTAQELALAQQAYDEKLAKDAELRAVQNERDAQDAAIKLERQTQDRAIEDQRALDAHNAALTKIDEKRTAEETALGAVDVAIQTVRGNEMALINTISGGLSTLQAKAYAFYQAASGRSSSSSSSSRGKLPGYAAGTPYLPQDTIAQVHKGEAIIPAARNPNNPGGRGMAINFSPQFKTVDMGGKQYALVSDVQAGFESLIQAVEHTIAIQFGN